MLVPLVMRVDVVPVRNIWRRPGIKYGAPMTILAQGGEVDGQGLMRDGRVKR